MNGSSCSRCESEGKEMSTNKTGEHRAFTSFHETGHGSMHQLATRRSAEAGIATP
jgi:hypothetical protein